MSIFNPVVIGNMLFEHLGFIYIWLTQLGTPLKSPLLLIKEIKNESKISDSPVYSDKIFHEKGRYENLVTELNI